MAYDAQLPHCFGQNDKKFALHALEEQQAFDWLVDLRKRGVTWASARKQIREYLHEQGVMKALISAEVSRARKMLRSWLQD